MDQKQQIADRLKQANNILVTVSSNPTVDQLASCIGMTLAFNKMGKHATAVFSGAVPNTIEFLEPEKTLETTTDSLRDFIISLDKAKADKLRYKVEDKVVKIFITPYRTSISEKDLEFGQGDFNVDVVLALGVHEQGELDQAITSHGRILHDATVITLDVKPGGQLGSLNWFVPAASSLCELALDILDATDKSVIDEQIATALLTGIVAETERFSNQKTSPDTMSISAELMAAGANQQLVASKLAPPPPPAPEPSAPAPQVNDQQSAPAEPPKSADGTLEIAHIDEPKLEEPKPEADAKKLEVELKSEEEKEAETPQIHIDDQGLLRNMEEMKAADAKESSTDPTEHLGGGRMILQPPSVGSAMSGAGTPTDGFSDPLSLPQPTEEMPSGSPPTDQPVFGASPASASIAPPTMPFMPPSMTPGASDTPSAGDLPVSEPSGSLVATDNSTPPGTLDPSASDTSHVDSARDAVMQAIGSQSGGNPEPIQALNAQPLGDILHNQPEPSNGPPDLSVGAPADNSGGLIMPSPVGAPPPVPPPLMPTSPQ